MSNCNSNGSTYEDTFARDKAAKAQGAASVPVESCGAEAASRVGVDLTADSLAKQISAVITDHYKELTQHVITISKYTDMLNKRAEAQCRSCERHRFTMQECYDENSFEPLECARPAQRFIRCVNSYARSLFGHLDNCEQATDLRFDEPECCEHCDDDDIFDNEDDDGLFFVPRFDCY